MSFHAAIVGLALLAFSFRGSAGSSTYVPSSEKPPAPAREFRGAWVATVGNIDWPSKPGLTTAQQKAELLAILDRAAYLRLNAIIFQVRPSCDALYASRLEPWSEYLTGFMGQAPNPPYDPLAFAVEQAHQRGLELHAWFNPYRARTPAAKSPISPNHVIKMHPGMVKKYGEYLWLDPGDTSVQDHIMRVFQDVVRRYDIDGVHIDDYFYPPQQKNIFGNLLPFPDWSSWRKYQASGGKLARDDWRRENVNRLVERLYRMVKSEKPRVKFGVSPSGIWRPGNPPQIRGGDPYTQIFADSRKWLANGWLDYFAPQLYWDISVPAQSYPVLLQWWAQQNVQKRHLWPGNAVSWLAKTRTAAEIVNQIRLTRGQPGATGNILWDSKPLLLNTKGIADALHNEVYTQPALVPASAWLGGGTVPETPLVNVAPVAGGAVTATWTIGGPEPVWLWVLQSKTGASWTTEILPAQVVTRGFLSTPDVIALTAIDHVGRAGVPCVLARQQIPAP